MMILITKVHVFALISLATRCAILHASKDVWPSGSYSLPKPMSGCPEDSWKDGWLKQDLEDDEQLKYHSKFSSSFHMNASLDDSEFVNRTFCTKVANTTLTKQNLWPKGFYCIYRKRQICPHSMVKGSIVWDDENYNNRNEKKGVLPDINTGDRNTELYYCCQDEGEWYSSIELPTKNPFYLLPYGSQNCQRVMGAVSSLEYIVYDTENYLNQDTFEGHHVYSDKRKSLPKIFYCYYEGCQRQVKNYGDHGSFYSPGFPNNSYPDFQFCSWSIAVNTTLQIVLTFPILNLPDCEENHLDIFDGVMEGSKVLARFCGENATSGVKVISTSNLLGISLKSGNNTVRKNEDDLSETIGFYAKYKSFLPATTSTASPPTILITLTTNNTLDSERKDLRQRSKENSSAIYLSVILPILAILLILGVLVAVFYRRRFSSCDHSPTVRHVKSKTSANPIYESGVNQTAYENDIGPLEMQEATENILYSPGNEVCVGNPLYQEVDNHIDLTYEEPKK